MTELKTFTGWLRFVELRPEALIQDMNQLSDETDELIKVLSIYRKYESNIDLASYEEKMLLRKYGYQPDINRLIFPPIIKFQDYL